MMNRTHILSSLKAVCLRTCGLRHAVVVLFCAAIVSLVGCEREPELHLRKEVPTKFTIANLALHLETYWNYAFIYGIEYNWEAEWYYGWDEEDEAIFGEIGYPEPTVFNFRRYYTASTPYAPHKSVIAHTIEGNEYTGYFELGFWDILVWNDIRTHDNVQSLNFDETSSLDSVIAYTNESMRSSRYQAPRYTHAFYQPEALYSVYEQAIEIDEDLSGFTYDPERDVWVKVLNMELRPITYIYLTQVILRHNNNKIIGIEGTGDLSSLARSTNVNSGKAGTDPVTVHYNMRMKKNVDREGENVDIVGGRLLTFGICNLEANAVKEPKDTTYLKQIFQKDGRHYMDVKMQFNNGNDTTFVFDVTDQVRKRFKGGVITVELDMDTISVSSRPGGSAFNAVVKDYEEEKHEFDM